MAIVKGGLGKVYSLASFSEHYAYICLPRKPNLSQSNAQSQLVEVFVARKVILGAGSDHLAQLPHKLAVGRGVRGLVRVTVLQGWRKRYISFRNDEVFR